MSGNNNFSGSPSRIFREQLITTEDLAVFKEELLEEIQKLLQHAESATSKKWLKSHEVRKMLGISPGTLQNMRINGSLPYIKVGGVIFYAYEDLQKMLEENRVQNSLKKY